MGWLLKEKRGSGRNQGVPDWFGRQRCFGSSGFKTGLPEKAEKLSRKAQNRDRFGGESGKAVKKSPEL
ncbi:hypothetical protein SAMD00020551_3558 [Mesobacillus selenatarsenatis SF-1]|uniref:Uncharacterized protein n=1 Tax=Mesobacillus selenatarsenatis (strain DSM 18680 / JCM 14380 / FERM P-15431 / SF-1) TaxID=1321606 RepID=A0A0A8XBA5_MESS1|nr:hypothetical protein SAMD00020551_3558 [Mesobacillus selenatarsenatis SF-1]